MDSIINVQFVTNILRAISDWFLGNVLVLGNVVQVIVIIVLLLISNLLGKRFLPRIPARIDSFIRRNWLLRNLFDTFVRLLPATGHRGHSHPHTPGECRDPLSDGAITDYQTATTGQGPTL